MKKEGRMYEVGRKEGRKKGRKERWKSGGRKKIRKEERKEGRKACGCFLRGKLLIEGSNDTCTRSSVSIGTEYLRTLC